MVFFPSHDFQKASSATLQLTQIKFVDGGIAFKIEVNFSYLRNLQAVFRTAEGKKERCPVEWKFPIISRQKFTKILQEDPSQLNISVERDAARRIKKITIFSQAFDEDAKAYFNEWNRGCYTQHLDRLKFFADWCNEAEDQEERELFLKGIVEEGRGNSNKGNACSNVMTILKLAGKVLPKELPQGELPSVDLSGAVACRLNMQRGNLTDANCELADLTDADLRMCRLAGIKFNRRPYLTTQDYIRNLAASSDGRYIAVGSETAVRVFDIQAYPYSDVFMLKFNELDLRITYLQQNFVLSKNGKWLIVSNSKGSVSIWSLSTFKELANYKCSKMSNIIGLQLSSCEQFLTASFSKDGVYVWKISEKRNKTLKLVLIWHKKIETPLVSLFSSNNSIIIVGDTQGKIWLLDRNSGKENKFVDLKRPIINLQFFHDGHTFLFTTNSKIWLGDFNNSTFVLLIEENLPIPLILLSEDNNDIIYVLENEESTLIRFNIEKKIKTLIFEPVRNYIYAMQLYNKNNLVLGTSQKEVHFIELGTPSQKNAGLESPILSANFCQNDKLLRVVTSLSVDTYSIFTGTIEERQKRSNFPSRPAKNVIDLEEEKYRICAVLSLQNDLSPSEVLDYDVTSIELSEPFAQQKKTLPFHYLISLDRHLLVLFDTRHLLKIEEIEIWSLEERCRLSVIKLDGNRTFPILAFGPMPSTANQPYYLAISFDNGLKKTEIQIWALTLINKKLLTNLHCTLKTEANKLLFSSDGNFLYIAGYDLWIEKWDIKRKKIVNSYTSHSWTLSREAVLWHDKEMYNIQVNVAAINEKRSLLVGQTDGDGVLFYLYLEYTYRFAYVHCFSRYQNRISFSIK